MRRMTSTLGTVVRMSWSQRVEFAKVCMLALACEVLIRARPLPEVARLFGVSLRPEPSHETSEPLEGDLPGWALLRLRMTGLLMRRWPVDGTCLRRSLVAGQRIRRLNPVLRIGVATGTTGSLDAHAWLEVNGRSLDGQSGRYETLSL